MGFGTDPRLEDKKVVRKTGTRCLTTGWEAEKAGTSLGAMMVRNEAYAGKENKEVPEKKAIGEEDEKKDTIGVQFCRELQRRSWEGRAVMCMRNVYQRIGTAGKAAERSGREQLDQLHLFLFNFLKSEYISDALRTCKLKSSTIGHAVAR